jgi:hypothetical protein
MHSLWLKTDSLRGKVHISVSKFEFELRVTPLYPLALRQGRERRFNYRQGYTRAPTMWRHKSLHLCCVEAKDLNNIGCRPETKNIFKIKNYWRKHYNYTTVIFWLAPLVPRFKRTFSEYQVLVVRLLLTRYSSKGFFLHAIVVRLLLTRPMENRKPKCFKKVGMFGVKLRRLLAST